MEHLRKAVELVTVIDGSELNLSISIEVSRWPEDGAHFSQIYKTADARLYQAKTLGRIK